MAHPIPTPGSHPLEASASLRMDRLRSVRRPEARNFDVAGAGMQAPSAKPPATPVAAV